MIILAMELVHPLIIMGLVFIVYFVQKKRHTGVITQ